VEVHTYVLNNHIKYQNYFDRLSEGLKKDAIRTNYSPTFARIDTPFMRINLVYIGVNGDESRLRGRRTHFLYVDKGITNEELINLAIKPMLFGQDKREERLHWI
jgi:hypothetical protein